MRVAVVGAGSFGRSHVRTLHEMGYLGTIADTSETVRKEVVNTYGVPTFGDYHQLIADGSDAVVIATPAETHYSIAKDFLEAGIPCLVEKPLTLNLAEAEYLVAVARDRGVLLMVGHLLVYQPAIQWISEAISSGVVGTLRSLHLERLNFGKARSFENALWSLGVHDVAVALFLVGSNPIHTAISGQSILTPGIEDDTYLHMEFESGIRAHVHSSWLWPELRRRLVVIGERGILVFDEPNCQVHFARKRIDEHLCSIDGGVELAFEGHSQPLRLELEHFIDSIHKGSSPMSDGQQGVDVLRVLTSVGN